MSSSSPSRNQTPKVEADLNDGRRRRTDTIDSDVDPVSLAYISYEDKSAKKNGTDVKK